MPRARPCGSAPRTGRPRRPRRPAAAGGCASPVPSGVTPGASAASTARTSTSTSTPPMRASASRSTSRLQLALPVRSGCGRTRRRRRGRPARARRRPRPRRAPADPARPAAPRASRPARTGRAARSVMRARHALARDRVGHEHDPSLVVRHEDAAVGDALDVELDHGTVEVGSGARGAGGDAARRHAGSGDGGDGVSAMLSSIPQRGRGPAGWGHAPVPRLHLARPAADPPRRGDRADRHRAGRRRGGGRRGQGGRDGPPRGIRHGAAARAGQGRGDRRAHARRRADRRAHPRRRLRVPHGRRDPRQAAPARRRARALARAERRPRRPLVGPLAHRPPRRAPCAARSGGRMSRPCASRRSTTPRSTPTSPPASRCSWRARSRSTASGGPFIRRVEGDPSTVVGLSLSTLRDLVRELGVDWPSLWNRR